MIRPSKRSARHVEAALDADLDGDDISDAARAIYDAPSEPPADHLGPTAQPSSRGQRIAGLDWRGATIDHGRHVSAQPDDDQVELLDPGSFVDPEEQGS